MTNVDVCNEALGRIGHGASRPIQSITEDSEAARACNRVFKNAMRRTLREFLWPWAQVVAPLTPISDTTQTLHGWPYLYAMPADCLYLHGVGVVGLDITQLPASAWPASFRMVQAANGQGQVVAAQEEHALGWYTRDVQDASFTDDHFRDALAWRVAAELALGLKADPSIAKWASDQYAYAVDVAAALVGNQMRHRNANPDNMVVRGAVPWSPAGGRW